MGTKFHQLEKSIRAAIQHHTDLIINLAETFICVCQSTLDPLNLDTIFKQALEVIVVHVKVGDSGVYKVEKPLRTTLEAGSQLFMLAQKSPPL